MSGEVWRREGEGEPVRRGCEVVRGVKWELVKRRMWEVFSRWLVGRSTSVEREEKEEENINIYIYFLYKRS